MAGVDCNTDGQVTEMAAAEDPLNVEQTHEASIGALHKSNSKKLPYGLPSKSSSAVNRTSGKSSSNNSKGPGEQTSAAGNPEALDKIRAARAAAEAGAASPETVSSTISKAKEALAKARLGAAPGGSLTGGHSTNRLSEGVGIVSDRPFTLYGRPELPAPRVLVQVSSPSDEEHARRRAWLAEKEAMKQRRLAQEQARKEREAAAKAAAASARAEAHRKMTEERKAKYEAFKAREASMLVKSEQAWKQYQEQRGRPPLFKLMEDDYKNKAAAEQEARRKQYADEVAAGKMASVSQLVKGEVVIRPPHGSISPGRSTSPGGCIRSPIGSGDHSHLLGRLSPNASLASIHSAPGKGFTTAGKGTKWPATHSTAAAVSKQLVNRACSPLTPDGTVPPGARVVATRLGRAYKAAHGQSIKDESHNDLQAEVMLEVEQHCSPEPEDQQTTDGQFEEPGALAAEQVEAHQQQNYEGLAEAAEDNPDEEKQLMQGVEQPPGPTEAGEPFEQPAAEVDAEEQQIQVEGTGYAEPVEFGVADADQQQEQGGHQEEEQPPEEQQLETTGLQELDGRGDSPTKGDGEIEVEDQQVESAGM